MIRRPPRSTQSRSSAASDVYKRQMLIAPRTQAFRRSFVSSCAVERMKPEACDGRNNWQSTFASCPLEGDAPRATNAESKHSQQHDNNDHYNGMSTQCVMLHAPAVAVHSHAPGRSSTLLIAVLANATSQRTGLEVHTHSKVITNTTAAQTMGEFSAQSGSALGCLPLAVSPWQPK